MKIACLEHLLPGGRLQEKRDFAVRAGYDAIELRGLGAYAFRQRLPELRRAVRDGVVLRMVSVDMRHYFGAFDRELRRDAIDQVKSQLSWLGWEWRWTRSTQHRGGCSRRSRPRATTASSR